MKEEEIEEYGLLYKVLYLKEKHPDIYEKIPEKYRNKRNVNQLVIAEHCGTDTAFKLMYDSIDEEGKKIMWESMSDEKKEIIENNKK